MANGLNKAVLKSGIKTLMQDMMTRETDSVDEFATRLSDAIDAYVKTAKINYTTGLVSPDGAVTGTFTGDLT